VNLKVTVSPAATDNEFGLNALSVIFTSTTRSAFSAAASPSFAPPQAAVIIARARASVAANLSLIVSISLDPVMHLPPLFGAQVDGMPGFSERLASQVAQLAGVLLTLDLPLGRDPIRLLLHPARPARGDNAGNENDRADDTHDGNQQDGFHSTLFLFAQGSDPIRA
jgi:hypothetical protein